MQVDRLDAEILSDILGGIPVSAIPEDHDTLTTALWNIAGLDGEPLPESIETRWELLANGTFGNWI